VEARARAEARRIASSRAAIALRATSWIVAALLLCAAAWMLVHLGFTAPTAPTAPYRPPAAATTAP
jgi:hypothetical protein